MQNATSFFRSFYFDEWQYLSNKTDALNATALGEKHWTVEDTAAAVAGSGLTAWEHFTRYGAFELSADGELGINPGDLFDVSAYYSDKIERDQETLGVTRTADELAVIFRDSGLDPVTHYALYGYAEGLEPEAEYTEPEYGHDSPQDFFRSFYFDEEQYIANKRDALNAEGALGRTWTSEDTAAAFAEAGLTAWEHFALYGAAELSADGGMGINPSGYFDLHRYYQDKIRQCQESEGVSHTFKSLAQAFSDSGLDPITHYALYGYLEGVAPVMANLPTIQGSTLDDAPFSGNALIDVLLLRGWEIEDTEDIASNWNKVGAAQDNTLYYTFSESSSVQDIYIGVVAPEFSPLTEPQRQGFEAALDAAAAVTGIRFEYTSDPGQANMYFFSAEPEDEDDWISYAWTEFSTLYHDKVAVALSLVELVPENADPRFGNGAFSTVLHEIGHVLGLKHPFDEVQDNIATFDGALDNEAYTIMSYTDPQEEGTEPWFDAGARYYSPFDLLALNYLYGTDGLNGSEGIVYDMPWA